MTSAKDGRRPPIWRNAIGQAALLAAWVRQTLRTSKSGSLEATASNNKGLRSAGRTGLVVRR